MFKTVFFGTDQYAAELLEALVKSPLVSVDLVITQPDKPVGRKKVLTPPPVKEIAKQHNITIQQPEKLRKSDIDISGFDVGIVTRYGQIIAQEMLDAPNMGLLNIHPSLLPLYRGATPLQSALIDGVEKTGVSIMRMKDGVDTGDVLGMTEIDVSPDDTYHSLSQKLTPISTRLLLELLPNYMDGSLTPKKQDNTKATLCQQFSKEDGRIDWKLTAKEIYNKFRGIGHWPGLWTMLNNKRLKLLDIRPSEISASPGEIVVQDGTIYIGTSAGAIQVIELQLEGKKAITAAQFAQGSQLNGEKLL